MEQKKALTFGVLVFIGINTILDAGIFFQPAVGAYYSGPASIIAWIFLIMVFLYIAACFSELVSMFPKAGGVYEYVKQTYGRIASFLIGWTSWLIANISVAMLVVGANLYLFPGNELHLVILRGVLAIVGIAIMNYVAYKGLQSSKNILLFFAGLTLFVIFLVMVFVVKDFSFVNYKPFFIHEGLFKNSFYMFITIFFVSEIFFGIEGITYLSEEVDKPEKVVPKAIFISSIVVGIIMLSLVFISLGSLNWALFSSLEAPYSAIVAMSYGKIGSLIISLLVYMVIMGTAVGVIVELPFLLMAMARDRLFLPQFAKRHPVYNSPHNAILFQAIVTIFLSSIGFFKTGFKSLVSLIVPLSILVYSFVILAVPIQRYKRPEVYRFFKAPLGKFLPYLVVVLQISLVIFWFRTEHGALQLMILIAAIVSFGIPIYFLISLYYDSKFITGLSDFISGFTFITERITLPYYIRKKIITYLGVIMGHHVLEIGCNTGAMTLFLVKNIGPVGRVYATDSSMNDLNILKRRLKHNNIETVEVFHDPNFSRRVHPAVPRVQEIVSIGIIGYIQNFTRFLGELNQRTSIGGKIVFLDYDRFFGFIPNIDWLRSDDKIKEIFEQNGFRVEIERIRGILWEYIIIQGRKFKDVYQFYYLSSEEKR